MIYICYIVVTDEVVISNVFQELRSFDIKTHEEATKSTLQLKKRDHHIETLKEVLKGK